MFSINHVLLIDNSYLNDDAINAFLGISKMTYIVYSTKRIILSHNSLDGSIWNDTIGHWLCVYYRSETKYVEGWYMIVYTSDAQPLLFGGPLW